MLKSRLYEEMVTRLWKEGLISGEMHLGTGEEAINAGVVSQLTEGDSIALDHRGTSPMLMRGIDPVSLLLEFLGHPDGICRGLGGHMHLYSKEHLIASSGIVGASGPAAAGFALSAKHLRPEKISVAFFGEGSLNQGMLMESMNLAAAWKLPLLFVCKDDNWSITTESDKMRGGSVKERAEGFGIPYIKGNGLDVEEFYETSSKVINSIRKGNGPQFLHAECVHLEGHFLGYQLIRMIRKPFRELPRVIYPLLNSFLKPGGANFIKKLKGIKTVSLSMLKTLTDARKDPTNDPLQITRKKLKSDPLKLKELENSVEKEIKQIFDSVKAVI